MPTTNGRYHRLLAVMGAQPCGSQGGCRHAAEVAMTSLRIREYPEHAQPRARLVHLGAEALSDAELLAVLIGAERLEDCWTILGTVGGWLGLQRATVMELCRLPGIGPDRAARLKVACELHRRLTYLDLGQRLQIRSPADAVKLLQAEIGHADQEHLVTLILNTKNRLLKLHTVYIGSVNAAAIRVGEVFREAIRLNAAAILVGHNHPSSDCAPSSEDILVTRQIVEAGKLLDITVLDHLIVSATTYTSLRERNLGFA
jgi:DNA repair protein RadC